MEEQTPTTRNLDQVTARCARCSQSGVSPAPVLAGFDPTAGADEPALYGIEGSRRSQALPSWEEIEGNSTFGIPLPIVPVRHGRKVPLEWFAAGGRKVRLTCPSCRATYGVGLAALRSALAESSCAEVFISQNEIRSDLPATTADGHRGLADRQR